MLRRQVGEAVRRRLVRHREGVAKILDRELARGLGCGEEVDRALLGEHQRAGQVVGLDPLPQELGEVLRLGAAEHVRRQRLQQFGARVAGALAHRQVDPSVRLIGHASRGGRQVGHVVQREAEVRGQVGGDALRERSTAVPHGGEQFASGLLQLGEVVAALALLGAQLRVRPARLLGGRRALAVQPLEFVVQREDRLDRLVAQRLAHRQRRQREARVQRTALRALQRDLERGPLRGRLGVQQLVERGAQRARQLLQLAQFQLAFAVLDHRDLRGRTTDRGGQGVEGEAAVHPELPDAAADREGVEHLFIVGCCALLLWHASQDATPLLQENRKIQIFLVGNLEKTACGGRRVEADQPPRSGIHRRSTP